MAQSHKDEAGAEPARPNKPTEEERTALRDAVASTRGHEEARQKAAREVADRNRKAHEKAVVARKARDAMREDLKTGLDF
jgi:hypothetical protein